MASCESLENDCAKSFAQIGRYPCERVLAWYRRFSCRELSYSLGAPTFTVEYKLIFKGRENLLDTCYSHHFCSKNQIFFRSLLRGKDSYGG